MNNLIKTIISSTNYKTNCRGLQQKEMATDLVSQLFAEEKVSFSDWKISEIPLIDDSGEYPVAVVICLENSNLRKAFSIGFGLDGEVEVINPDESEEIEVSSIVEAIDHPASSY